VKKISELKPGNLPGIDPYVSNKLLIIRIFYIIHRFRVGARKWTYGDWGLGIGEFAGLYSGYGSYKTAAG
jgi:hypothetical protein